MVNITKKHPVLPKVFEQHLDLSLISKYTHSPYLIIAGN